MVTGGQAGSHFNGAGGYKVFSLAVNIHVIYPAARAFTGVECGRPAGAQGGWVKRPQVCRMQECAVLQVVGISGARCAVWVGGGSIPVSHQQRRYLLSFQAGQAVLNCVVQLRCAVGGDIRCPPS